MLRPMLKLLRRLEKFPKFRVPFDISAMAEAAEFKFGTQLGFAKAHHKIPPREKVYVALV